MTILYVKFYQHLFTNGSVEQNKHTKSSATRCKTVMNSLTLNDALASDTAFSMNSSDICLDGCSLNTEFIRAILAALRRASAFVGQFCNKSC